jgi:hypothetical protein
MKMATGGRCKVPTPTPTPATPPARPFECGLIVGV